MRGGSCESVWGIYNNNGGGQPVEDSMVARSSPSRIWPYIMAPIIGKMICSAGVVSFRSFTSAFKSPHLKLRESRILESGMVHCTRRERRCSSCGGVHTETRYFRKYHSRNCASFSASSKSRAQGMNASQPRTLLPPPLKPDLAPSRKALEAGEVVIASKLRYMDSDGSMAAHSALEMGEIQGERLHFPMRNPKPRGSCKPFKTGKICQLSKTSF